MHHTFYHSYFEAQHMQFLKVPTLSNSTYSIHSHITHKRSLTLSCYLYINKEKQGWREKNRTATLLAYHISLRFSPVAGQLMVSIHTAAHHVAML